MVMKPLSIDVRRDNNCSLEHVVSEAVTRVPSPSYFLTSCSPSKPRVIAFSVALLTFPGDAKDLSLDLSPSFGILLSIKDFAHRSQ